MSSTTPNTKTPNVKTTGTIMTSGEKVYSSQPVPDGGISIALANVLVLAAAAVVLALPLLIHGPMVKGHDTNEHLNYCRYFAEQFWEGEWNPHWLLNLNHGLGSPSFFVYPPLPSYAYTFLQPIGRLFHFNPFSAAEFLALFISGIGAFLWIQTFASRNVALASALLYLLMPYHLAVDFYRRTALSECWAFAWMPLVLYFAAREVSRKRDAFVGLAAVYALLILSHLVSVLIFSLLPLIQALLMSAKGEKLRSAVRVAAAMTLGTGLSCFYFLPALFHAKYFPVLNILSPPYYVLEDNFLGLSDLKWSGGRSGFVHWVSLTALSMLAFLAICGLAVFLKGRSESRRLSIFWLAACILPVFLMSGASLWLWRSFPPLFKAVQYPWRFNMVLCLAALCIGALFLSELRRFSPVGRNVMLGVLSLIVLSWCGSYLQIWSRYRTEVFSPVTRNFVNEDDGWFDAWTAPGLDQMSALKASADPRVRFLEATGAPVSTASADVRVWKARHIEFQTNSLAGGWVAINQFYFPLWKATASGVAQPLHVGVVLPAGLVTIEVPPGRQTIDLQIPVEPVERAGLWISVGSLLFCVALIWKDRSKPITGVRPQSL